jgi:hypothetical protein
MPINMNNAVQTGAKIQLGGVIGGRFISRYQVFTDWLVAKEPIKPAPSVITREIISFIISNFIYYLLGYIKFLSTSIFVAGRG